MKEKQTNEKLIGLVVGGIANEFSKEIIKGIVNRLPKNTNIRLAILPGELMVENFQGDTVSQHNYMFNSVYNLGSVCKMDGLIIAMGSIGWALKKEQIHSFLDQYKDIPTVLLASDFEEYTTVNYDNKMGISETINVLVSEYGFTHIGMIGGYEENVDSTRRREIYIECLAENGISFDEKLYVSSDMSENTEGVSEKLLNDNPDIQAIFCVNDASAVGLYNVMKRRGLVPGKDIQVFGFDNTHMAAEMTPTLSSIGSESVTLGQKALELLLKKIEGEKVESVNVPTRLYGRQSLKYDKYEYSLADLSIINEDLINRMFDECFYRYANETISREDINLKRLFYEILSRMFKGIRKRYIGKDEFEEIGELIDIFFRNRAMEYTDVSKFIESVTRLQTGINRVLRGKENTPVNRLFLRMKDDALRSVSEMRTREFNAGFISRDMFRKFLIKSMDYNHDKDKVRMDLLTSINMVGIKNAALYIFESPVTMEQIAVRDYPELIRLVSVVKSDVIYQIPEGRQYRPLSDIFIQREIKVYNKNFVTFPIFYEKSFYGLLLTDLSPDIYDKGEMIATLIGMVVHLLKSEVKPIA